MNFIFKTILISTVFIADTIPAFADPLVINGLYDCQRATNGRAYCKKVGAPVSAQYVPVTDDFFATYETARTGKVPSQPAPVVNQSITNDNTKVIVNNTQFNISVALKDQATNLAGQIYVLEAVLKNQDQSPKSDGSDQSLAADAADAIKEQISELRSKLAVKNSELVKNYATPIRPDDMNTGVTARKASEFYPKIPYYIPGTQETGEFWVEPIVTDTGVLKFNFKFVDVESTSAEKVRSSIEMTIDQVESTQAALVKIAKNSKIAHEKGIRRKLDQRVTCFPDNDCPSEGKKIDQKLSTEIVFSINDDGAINGRIQINKGRFEEGYNLSVKSALLLQAYLKFILKDAQKEFNAGSASDDEIKQLFK